MDIQQYNWNWSDKHCSANDHLPADQLDRAKYAKFLANYLSRFTDKPYVMNLNAEWGAGKTWFLQRWYQTVKEHHPAAYIDAWNSDFSDDPLLTVASGLLEALERSLPSNAAAEKYRALSLRKLGLFIKGAAKNAALHQANKYLGEDAVGVIQSGLAEVTETVVSSVIKDHRRKLSVINELKEAIEHWISLITEKSNLRKPMFVFIDELDRCRPTYAIELLETVKHLFGVEGLVFVIATNADQLQQSIKAVYGSEFDAQRYLYRFFNRSFMLKKPDLLPFIKTLPVFDEHLSQVFLTTCNQDLVIKDTDTIAANLAVIAESFAFDLRTTQQWLEQLSAIYSENEISETTIWLVMALMLATKLKHPKAFSDIFLDDLHHSKLAETSGHIQTEYSLLQSNNQSPVKIVFQTKKKHLLTAMQNPGSQVDPSGFDESVTKGFSISTGTLCRLSSIMTETNLREGMHKSIYFPRMRNNNSIGDIDGQEAFISLVYSLHRLSKDTYIDFVELATNLE